MTIVGAARYVDTYAYDTLVNLPGPGKVVTGLAQSWKVVSPKKVEFTLFKGITCSDGTQMTATVVKQNLDFVFVSRELKPDDIDEFTRKFGYAPGSVPVSGSLWTTR